MIFLGDANGRPAFTARESHLLVLGPPRSGKTTSVIVPNLTLHRGPAVVTSTKNDILAATQGSRSKLGPVFIFDPSGRIKAPQGVTGVRWSPVEASGTLDAAIRIADLLVDVGLERPYGEGSHWAERAKALIAPILLSTNLAGGSMADVVGGIDERDIVRFAPVLEANDQLRALQILLGLAQTDQRELSGIFSTASGSLGAYRSEAALKATENPNFDPWMFVRSGGTLFVISSSAEQKIAAPVIVTLLDQIRSAAYERSPRGASPSEQVLMCLDELANVAPLPNLASVLSEGASQGVTVIGCLQDLSQARQRWGRSASGFLTLFGTTLLLPGIADAGTLSAISEVSGTRFRQESQVSFVGPSILKRRSQLSMRSVETRFVAPGELAQIPKGSAMVFDWKQPPGMIKLKPIFARRCVAIDGISRSTN